MATIPFRFPRVGRPRVHLSILLLPAFLVLGSDPPIPSIWGEILILGLGFAAVLWHEYGHLLAQAAIGETPGPWRLTLVSPSSEIARYQPRSEKDERFVALAGPLASFVLAGALHVAADAFPSVAAVCLWWAWVNAALGIASLLPLYPMDGGVLLRSLLFPDKPWGKGVHALAFWSMFGWFVCAPLGVWMFRIPVIIVPLFCFPFLLLFRASADLHREVCDGSALYGVRADVAWRLYPVLIRDDDTPNQAVAKTRGMSGSTLFVAAKDGLRTVARAKLLAYYGSEGLTVRGISAPVFPLTDPGQDLGEAHLRSVLEYGGVAAVMAAPGHCVAIGPQEVREYVVTRRPAPLPQINVMVVVAPPEDEVPPEMRN